MRKTTLEETLIRSKSRSLEKQGLNHCVDQLQWAWKERFWEWLLIYFSFTISTAVELKNSFITKQYSINRTLLTFKLFVPLHRQGAFKSAGEIQLVKFLLLRKVLLLAKDFYARGSSDNPELEARTNFPHISSPWSGLHDEPELLEGAVPLKPPVCDCFASLNNQGRGLRIHIVPCLQALDACIKYFQRYLHADERSNLHVILHIDMYIQCNVSFKLMYTPFQVPGLYTGIPPAP